jgi:triosephosphate isomerase (TIM)
MRRPLIAGNWKMNTTHAAAVELARGVAHGSADYPQLDLIVCPPFVYLEAVRKALGDAPVALGAQNMYHQSHGAFTGEISAAMLVDIGCQYVILGHSERRQFFKETDAEVNQKLLAALAAGLTPIVCVGELLADREAGRTHDVIRRQFDGSLAGISADQITRLVIAYEPVWAIGTGRVATPDQAQDVHRDLRKMLVERYNAELAAEVRIQYGGSVKPDNAAALLSEPDIDGALVGGACLKVADFLGIASAASQAG